MCSSHKQPSLTHIFPLNALYENRIIKATKRTSRDRAEKKRGMHARVHPSKAEALSPPHYYLGCKFFCPTLSVLEYYMRTHTLNL